jgi:hypothetical protein
VEHRVLGVLVAVLLTGCAGLPGVSGSAEIASLPDADVGKLCDWYAGLVGGYGQKACSSGSYAETTTGSQADCVSISRQNNAACTATVSQWEACAQVIAAADACSATAVAEAQTSDACQIFYGDSDDCADIH